MSNFRKRAAEIRAAGEKRRGNYTPQGAPLRIYNYWRKNTDNPPARENFCHYVRVVLFWAPLMFLRVKTRPFTDSIAFPLTIVAVFVLAVAALGIKFTEFGIVLLAILAVAAGLALIFGFFYAIEQFFGMKAAEKAVNIFAGGAASIAVLSLLVLFVVEVGILPLLAIIVGAAVFLLGLWLLVSKLIDLYEYRTNKRIEEFERKVEAGEPLDEYREPREPGKASKAFVALGEFVILVSQFLRVQKWKICPTVEVKTE